MLRTYGLKVPKSELAASASEAADVAAGIGFPVALKVESPDIVHKTDVGGVVLNVGSARDVKRGFTRILGEVRRRAPQARVQGIRVEEMCAPGVEVIIGLTRDPQFGPCIMFGLGGVLTELLEDVAFRVLPLTRRDAMDMIDEVRGRAILDGYRGQPPVSREMLVELLLQVGRLGMDVGETLGAVDLNPVVLWGDDYRVLDAKLLLNSEPAPVKDGTPRVDDVETFFYPRSVALIGASATPGKIGHAILDSLIRAGYSGSIHPINPTHEEVMGRRAYASVKDVPGPVDLVVVALPLAATPGLVADCAAKGVRNIVIISGGGKELGGDSQALESQIVSLARDHGIRIVGPNCIGVVNPAVNLDTLFMVRERMTRPRPGRIAMITQSGTVGVAFLEAAARVGISKFVSYGNRADVDEADLLAYLAGDEQTATIACYVEGFADGRKFLQAARTVNLRKPIVIFKAGRSQQGARASLSHTGFFGGLHGVSRGAFRQAGLIDVDSVEQLYEAAKALTLQPAAAGPRVGMISNGAGTVIQAIDLLATAGLELTQLSQETEGNLRRLLPAHCIAHNPVDVTGSASAEDYRVGIQGLSSDAAVDVVMPWFVFQDTPLGEDIVDILGDLSKSSGKPIVCGGMGGTYTDQMATAIEAAGVPVARSVSAWIAAARALVLSGRRGRGVSPADRPVERPNALLRRL